jgi:hypothetical protein
MARLVRVVVAWVTVFVWLMFGTLSLYVLEHGQERMRAQSYCAHKTGLIANTLQNYTACSGFDNVMAVLGSAAPSCEQFVGAIEETSKLLQPGSVCRPPDCKANVVKVAGGNETVVYSVNGYNWQLPGSFFFCLTACSTIGCVALHPSSRSRHNPPPCPCPAHMAL